MKPIEGPLSCRARFEPVTVIHGERRSGLFYVSSAAYLTDHSAVRPSLLIGCATSTYCSSTHSATSRIPRTPPWNSRWKIVMK